MKKLFFRREGNDLFGWESTIETGIKKWLSVIIVSVSTFWLVLLLYSELNAHKMNLDFRRGRRIRNEQAYCKAIGKMDWEVEDAIE